MYPEALLSVSSDIPLRDSGGGDITGKKYARIKICPLKSEYASLWSMCILLSREEWEEDLCDGSIITAPGGSRTG